jgi:hypothetical protein
MKIIVANGSEFRVPYFMLKSIGLSYEEWNCLDLSDFEKYRTDERIMAMSEKHPKAIDYAIIKVPDNCQWYIPNVWEDFEVLCWIDENGDLSTFYDGEYH